MPDDLDPYALAMASWEALFWLLQRLEQDKRPTREALVRWLEVKLRQNLSDAERAVTERLHRAAQGHIAVTQLLKAQPSDPRPQ